MGKKIEVKSEDLKNRLEVNWGGVGFGGRYYSESCRILILKEKGLVIETYVLSLGKLQREYYRIMDNIVERYSLHASTPFATLEDIVDLVESETLEDYITLLNKNYTILAIHPKQCEIHA